MVSFHRFRHPVNEPFRADESLALQRRHTHGAVPFLNPTRSRFHHFTPHRPDAGQTLASTASHDSTSSSTAPLNHESAGRAPTPPGQAYASAVAFDWRSRDNRKGRHTLLVDPTILASSPFQVPKPTNTWGAVGDNLMRMASSLQYWNISWIIAVLYVFGSAVWVIDVFFVWLPLARPETEFEGEVVLAGGYTAFVAATVFEIGGALLVLEAINTNRAGCFGWIVEHVAEGLPSYGELAMRVRPKGKACAHHQHDPANVVGRWGPAKTGSEPLDGSTEMAFAASHDDEEAQARPAIFSSNCHSWQWYPSMHDLRTHYLYSLGFLASFIEFVAATVYWISSFVGLPPLNERVVAAGQGALDGAFWFPQILGGVGYLTSSILFMLETQEVWYRPAPRVLGWWVGAWNVVGSLGFTLCGVLGPAIATGNPAIQFQASLSLFWGAWAFLIASCIQWYEALDTHPVETASLAEIRGAQRANEKAGRSAAGVAEDQDGEGAVAMNVEDERAREVENSAGIAL